MHEESPRFQDVLARIEQALADSPGGFPEVELVKRQLIKVREVPSKSKERYLESRRLHDLLQALWSAANLVRNRGYVYRIGRVRADLALYMISLAEVAREKNETVVEAETRLSQAYHDQEAELGAYFARHLAQSDTRQA
jgi:hypothetical protein